MVRLAGLEPARVTPLPPQSSVSANSTISATASNEAVLQPVRKAIYLPVRYRAQKFIFFRLMTGVSLSLPNAKDNL